MGAEIIFKIAGIGILTSIINQILKISGKDEIATLTTLSGVIVCLLMVMNLITELFNSLNNIFSLF